MASNMKQRRSAFSVYAENKPEPQLQAEISHQSKMIDKTRIIRINKTAADNTNKRNKQKQRRKQRLSSENKNFQITKTFSNNHLNGISKPKSSAVNQKKTQMKFGKISNENINECIHMFSANPKPAFTASKPPRKVLQSTPLYVIK